MTDNAKNKGFIIREDKLKGGKTKIYWSGSKSDGAEKERSL